MRISKVPLAFHTFWILKPFNKCGSVAKNLLAVNLQELSCKISAELDRTIFQNPYSGSSQREAEAQVKEVAVLARQQVTLGHTEILPEYLLSPTRSSKAS